MFEKLYHFFSSLKLTVTLLIFSMALVFFGTLDQVNYGIFEVQQRYFKSIVVLWQYPPQWIFGNVLQYLHIPMLGGYTIGTLLLINLFVAHFKYYNSSFKKSGIMLIHLGLVLLIISGFLSGFLQIESQMWIKENSKANYSQSNHYNELVIIDKTKDEIDTVYAIPENHLKTNTLIKDSKLPFNVRVIHFYENADIAFRSQTPLANTQNIATQGAGLKMDIVAMPIPKSYKDEVPNAATAYIDIIDNEGDSIGVWLVSNLLDDQFPPQRFTHEDRQYEVALRFKRYYYPFWLKLNKFSFDRYPGTEIPKNFSSKIEIINPVKNEIRDTLIYMNNPLRYEGKTFYQASFGDNEKTSILQVMQNPSWQLPYWSVLIIGLGLLIQFLLSLTTFLKKHR